MNELTGIIAAFIVGFSGLLYVSYDNLVLDAAERISRQLAFTNMLNDSQTSCDGFPTVLVGNPTKIVGKSYKSY